LTGFVFSFQDFKYVILSSHCLLAPIASDEKAVNLIEEHLYMKRVFSFAAFRIFFVFGLKELYL